MCRQATGEENLQSAIHQEHLIQVAMTDRWVLNGESVACMTTMGSNIQADTASLH